MQALELAADPRLSFHMSRHLKHFCGNSLPQMHLVARSAFDRLVAPQPDV
jgi:hypothetical protein